MKWGRARLGPAENVGAAHQPRDPGEAERGHRRLELNVELGRPREPGGCRRSDPRVV